jgi:Fe-S oxidoreductase
MCRFSCPVSEATKNDTTTPWGKMQTGAWLLDKRISLSQETVQAAYQCTNCLHCQQYCEHLNDVPESLRDIRQLAAENYVAPDRAYDVQKKFSAYNNPYGLDFIKRMKRIEFRHREKADVLFFPSCHTLHYFPERVSVYLELFDKLKVGNVTMDKELIPCCGEPLRALGFQRDFQDLAEIQYHAFKKYAYVVTDGPECCNSLKQHYRDQDLPLNHKTLHLLEFLAPYLEHSNYRTLGKVKGRLAYHDPSHLARYLGIMDLPRRLIAHVTGFVPVDLSWSGKDTLSSGAEGSYEMIFPEISDQIAARTVQEVSSRRIRKLITACAKSEAKFRALAKDFEVQDLYEYLNQHILTG